jgi:hypothetical protein
VEERIYTEVTENTEYAEKREAKERSLDYATRRAKLRRGGENQVAPLGMTVLEAAAGWGGAEIVPRSLHCGLQKAQTFARDDRS